jgi:hypothetical protein
VSAAVRSPAPNLAKFLAGEAGSGRLWADVTNCHRHGDDLRAVDATPLKTIGGADTLPAMKVILRIGWCAGLTLLVAGTVWAIRRGDPVAALFGAAAVIGYLVGPIPFPFRRAPKPEPPMIAFLPTPASRTHASRSVVDPWAEWH